jgi:sulfate permease, SulP family
MVKKNIFNKAQLFDICFTPFVKDISKYGFKKFRKDIFSAFSITFIAIPQSIAYSLLAGLPPIAGIFSAIFGTIFTGIFSSSKHLVSGPSTGISILIQTSIAFILQTHFPDAIGAEKAVLAMHILMQIVLIMGLVQVIGSFLNFGKVLQFVSRSVILGYFGGVAIAILINQLFFFLGINSQNSSTIVIFKIFYLLKNIHNTQIVTLLIGIISIFILLSLKWKYKKLPSALIMLIFSTILAYFLTKYDFVPIKTISDFVDMEKFTINFSLPYFDLELIKKIYPAAIAISFISILEVFSISRGIAAKSGQSTYANQEVFAVGISNAFLSFVTGAMPASGSLSRSIVNFESHAKTRFASIYSGILIAVFMFFLWPLIKYIPLCSLAAILIFMMNRLLNKEELRICFLASTGDAVVFSLTLISCLIFTLDVAFFIGIVIAIAFYLKKASIPHLEEYSINTQGRLTIINPKKIDQPRDVRIVGIAGGLFFANVDVFQHAMHTIIKDPTVKAIILRLNKIYYVDATMCFALLRLYQYLRASKRKIYISGITVEVWEIFDRCGVVKEIGKDNLFLADESKPQESTLHAYQKAEKEK